MKLIIKTAFLFLLLSVILCSCEKECKHDNVGTSIIAPTCTEGGYTLNKCLDCGTTYVTDKIDPNGHTIKSVTTPPSCDKQGYTENSCDCGYSYVSDNISPLNHAFSVSTIVPTCDKQGYTVHICNKCEYRYIDGYTAPTGHNLKTTVIAPSCTEQGYTVYTCSCGYTYNADHVPALEHQYTQTVIEATCEGIGYTVHTCDCGFEYRDDYVAAKEHTYSKVTTDPTCEAAGFTTYTCECGFTYISDYLSPTGHVYTETITPASCTEAGFTTGICACGDVMISDYTDALGHDFHESVTLPTVTSLGYSEFACEACSFSYKDNYRHYIEIFPDGAYAPSTTVLANGIDISKWNHSYTSQDGYLPLDWSAIKSEGVDYVILKAGSSISGKEPTFDMDYADAREAGLDIGVYFYTYAKNIEDITADAHLLLSILDGKQFEYPIYLDLEDDSLIGIDKSTLTEMCLTFFSVLQENGYYTGLYVNNNWLHNMLETDKILEMCDVWYARYPLNVDEYVWDVEKYGDPLGMWQYTDAGMLESIPGISVNLSYSYKDYPIIIKMLGLNGY